MTSWYRHIYLDYRRYRATDESWAGTLFLSQGFAASTVYRIAHAVTKMRPGIIQTILRVFMALAQKLIEVLTGICLPRHCEIGEGLYIGHYGTIIFPRYGQLGRNCNVGQTVTMGVGGIGDHRGCPSIGDRVFIGPHSVIVGKITIGDDAMIGAGAVITRSVPARAVVLGNPARVISFHGSFSHIAYDGMESDPDRNVALNKVDALQAG